MKAHRQLLNVFWMDMQTNDWVPGTLKTQRQLLSASKAINLLWVWARNEKETSFKYWCLDKTYGKPRAVWIDDSKTWSGS